MPIIVHEDVTLMKVCEPKNKRPMTEFSVREMRKKRSHNSQICHLGTAIILIVKEFG
jgi:hypothetical protein